ncbi:hypothetical protein [Actinacidiphila bryophytorum]|nr:hypothetical protein [Actinacidiphila bryophytorum]MBM9436325.1 hypothetical protein [Actinacidiphila bryophytorum]MBN6546985.1 hypothetical protein [Actinacidiphila bryophytorum]
MRSTPRATGVTSPLAPAPLAEPDSMEQLIGDCRQMAAHWHMPSGERTSAAPAGLHGITVPPASAHVVAGMVEFGD